MINGRSVLAVITARGGSKGLPRKNLLDLCGKPMLVWSLEAGRDSACVDRVVLSSEDPEIIEVSKAHGCEVPFVRPLNLATDETTTMAVLAHLMDALPERYDYLVLLQPTSPLRLAADIDGALEKCEATGAPACVSVSPSAHSPYKMYKLDEQERLIPVMGEKIMSSRRQDLPASYAANGAVFAARCDWLRDTGDFFGKETIAFMMPASRSIDIDDADDFLLAEFLLNRRVLLK